MTRLKSPEKDVSASSAGSTTVHLQVTVALDVFVAPTIPTALHPSVTHSSRFGDHHEHQYCWPLLPGSEIVFADWVVFFPHASVCVYVVLPRVAFGAKVGGRVGLNTITTVTVGGRVGAIVPAPPGPKRSGTIESREISQAEHCWAPPPISTVPKLQVVEQPRLLQFSASWHFGQPALHGRHVLYIGVGACWGVPGKFTAAGLVSP